MRQSATTAVDRVFAAFTRFLDSNHPDKVGHRTLLQAWAVTFPDTNDSPTCLEIMGRLAKSVRLVRDQIASSKLLNAPAKSSYLGIVKNLAAMLAQSNLDQAVLAHRESYAERSLGLLGGLSHTLGSEFPEPVISDDKVGDLLGQLVEIKNEVLSSDFDANFKMIVADHIGFILWALNNQNFVGAGAIREAAASIILSVKEKMDWQIAEHDPVLEGSDKFAVLHKLASFAGVILSTAFRADVTFHGLLGFVGDIGPLIIPSAQ